MDVMSFISSSFECFNNDDDMKDEMHSILLKNSHLWTGLSLHMYLLCGVSRPGHIYPNNAAT